MKIEEILRDIFKTNTREISGEMHGRIFGRNSEEFPL